MFTALLRLCVQELDGDLEDLLEPDLAGLGGALAGLPVVQVVGLEGLLGRHDQVQSVVLQLMQADGPGQ